MPVPTQYDFDEMIMEISRGNEVAFRQLFDWFHPKIYLFAFFLTRSETLAKDITQDIFIKVWMHREELKEIVHFEAWLKKIVRNHTFNYLHRLATERQVLNRIQQQMDQRTVCADDEWLTREYNRLLEQAIDQLSAQQKKVFLLSRREGMKNEAIARAMGISVNTVKSHLKVALQSIRLFFEDHSDIIAGIAILLFFYN